MFQVLSSLIVLALSVLVPLRALADVADSRYVPARALSAGGAGIPLVDDGAGALFYQPAMLSKGRRVNIEPLNLQIYGDSGFFGTANQSSLNAMSIEKIAGNLRSNPNTRVGFGGAILPSISLPFLSFGILAQTKLLAYADDQSVIHSKSLYQLVPAIGTGVSLGHGILKLGYSLQYVNQASGEKTIPAGTSAGGFNQGIAEGHAFSHNVGMALTLPYQHLPSFHAVVRNLGNARYSGGSLYPMAQGSVGVPDTEKMSFDAALGWHEKIGGGNTFRWSMQARDFTNTKQVSPALRYLAGLELSFRDVIMFRGGYGNGYPSAGIGFRVKNHSDFSLAWYSEELTNRYHGYRDQRYMFQYQLRLF